MKLKIYGKLKAFDGLTVFPVFQQTISELPQEIPKSVVSFIKKRVKNDNFSAKDSEEFLAYFDERGIGEKIAIVGLGDENKFDSKRAREFGARLAKLTKKSKSEELGIFLLPQIQKFSSELFEGILLSQYKFQTFKKSNPRKKSAPNLQRINIVTTKKSKSIDEDFEHALLIAEASEFTKDLVNNPSNTVDADYLAEEARKMARKNGYKLAIFGNKELKKMGWGGILAVNQGSEKEAKGIVLEYRGAKDRKEKPIVLVGKGVIFDTGGYNLKPAQGIGTMHQDMAGAAVVLGIFSVLKRLGIRKNVIGVIGSTENLINENAYRPSDIITMFSGATVEITNTDAEGRLVLADCLTYTCQLKPEEIITIATLTGAVGVALGDRYAGVLGNDEGMRIELKSAGEKVDELLWPLPIHEDYRRAMESKIADLRNHDNGRYAGTAKAAAFLENFVEKNKWSHLDIGGTAFTESPKSFEQKGATAYGIRSLLKYLEN